MEQGAEGVTVSICILNRNGKDLLRACLQSCLAELDRSGLRGEIIVVDNASDDGSPEMVRDHFPQARLIRNRKNEGFAEANNRAIAASTGRYVFALNNDTVLLSGCLRELAGYMDAHPGVGAAGPKLLNPDRSVQLGYHRRLPRLSDSLVTVFGIQRLWPANPVTRKAVMFDVLAGQSLEEPFPIEQVGGCAMCLRREAVNEVGMFDADYYLWYEDVDLCQRMARGGWETVYVPKAEVIHYAGSTFGLLPAGEKLPLRVGSLLLFYRKNRSQAQFRLLQVMTLISLLLRLLVAVAFGAGPRASTRHRWRGAVSAHVRALKAALLL
jgi:hypothetical protein